ncbi:MAG: MFS transporter [Bdellovibrionales bacterium]|nr:MFS transporter [Bdellovibrionales bacterium]
MKRSHLLPISLIVAVDVLGLTLVIPLLPFYAEKYGASPSVVGLLVSAYAACQLVSGPFLGSLSDRYGRRPVLILSQIGTFIGFMILAHANALWMIFLSRLIDGSTAGNLSVAQAYIADVTPPEDRAKSFGIIGIAFGFGFLIGPALSGFLSHFGYVYPIYLAAALSLTSIIGTSFILPEPERHVSPGEERKLGLFQFGSYAKDFRNPKVSSTLWQFVAFFMAFSTFIAGIALFAERRFSWHGTPFGPREVGFLFAYTGLLGIFIQGGFLARMVKKYGEERLVIFAFASAAIGYGCLSVAHSIPALLVAATFSAFGSGGLRPSLTALVSRQAGRHEQGRMMGLIQGLNSISSIIGPIFSGLLIDRGWLAAWAGLMGLFSVWGLALILRDFSSRPSEAFR